MREIKFRAWLPDRKRMLYDGSWFETRVGFADSGGDKLLVGGEGVFLKSMYDNGHPYKLAATPMQYTGLKDRNGKEIYEGDIVKCYGGTENEIVGDIYWYKGGFSVRTVDTFWSPAEKDWGVIGNIYENPDLLAPQEPTV